MEKFIKPGLLPDNADSVKEDFYSQSLTKEELIISKDELAERSIEVKRLETLEKDRRKESKLEIAPVIESREKLIDEIKTGVREKYGKIYLLSDQKKGIMAFYSEEGHLINERPLLPEEKQLTIIGKEARLDN